MRSQCDLFVGTPIIGWRPDLNGHLESVITAGRTRSRNTWGRSKSMTTRQKVRAEQVNPFLSPAKLVWNAELGCDLELIGAELVSHQFTTEDLTAVIGVSGKLEGNVSTDLPMIARVLRLGRCWRNRQQLKSARWACQPWVNSPT
jgi:hypothetical protein